MIIEKTPLPLPVDIKSSTSDIKRGSGSMSTNAKASYEVAEAAVAMAHACEELGLPPPPAYDDLPQHPNRRISRLAADAKDKDKDKDLHQVLLGDEKVKTSIDEKKGKGAPDALALPPTAIFDSPGASSSRVALPLPSPTSAAASSIVISGPYPSAPSSPRPTISKKGSKSASGISSEQRGEVRTTVLGFVRDLVTKAPSAHGTVSGGGLNTDVARGILASCANACRAHGVHFGQLLQARCVAGHTPLYWTVVNRQLRPQPYGVDVHQLQSEEDVAKREDDELLHALLAYAGALSAPAMDDLRLACLVAADNVLLQRLRATPAVNPLAGTDVMLLFGARVNGIGSSGIGSGAGSGAEGIPMAAMERYRKGSTFGDYARVIEGRAHEQDESAFRVEVELDMFQRRMRVTGEVAVEFIARGRLWTLCFFVIKPPSTSIASLTSGDKDKNKNRNAPNPKIGPAASRVPLAVRLAAKARGLPAGVWVVALALLPHSPPCALDARLVVAEPVQSPSSNRLPSPTRPTSQVMPGHGRTSSGSDYLVAPPTHPSHLRSTSSPHLHEQHRAASAPAVQSQSLRSRTPSVPFLDRFTSSPGNRSRTVARPPIVLRLNHTTGSSTSVVLVAPSPPEPSRTGSSNSITGTGSGAVNSDDSEWEYEYDSDAPEGFRRKPKKKTKKERKEAKREAEKEAARVKREEMGKETRKEKKEQKRQAETVLMASLDEIGPNRAGKEGGGCLMYDNCSYITRDGTLRAVIEAQLRGPNTGGNDDGGCIIC